MPGKLRMEDSMADEWKVNRSVVRIVKADLLEVNAEGIVYYARTDLMLGSGLGGAIAAKGGPKIQEELKKLAPVPTGQAVVTAGGNLKAKYIIHAVGPKFQEEDLEEKLKTTMENALQKAEENHTQTLAFPAMGAGFYGVPVNSCADIMLSVIGKYLKTETSLKEIIVCLRDSREFGMFQKKIKEMQ